ncbi:MAG: PH domain-containing protein [Candidatus Obscuribacterales bacterium]|nr:PH domain-containing protein [Candidatus Obscuribacterales bacterium]
MKRKKEFKQVELGVEPVKTEFLRSRWKHYLRWLIFCFALLLYIMLILTSYHSHVLLQKGFLLQELVVYVLCSLMMLPILPSVVLEVDYLRLEDDGIVLQNLLFRRKLLWDEIQGFIDPRYLKFAILRGKKFFYLLNRRDLPHFDEIAEAIRAKATKIRK